MLDRYTTSGIRETFPALFEQRNLVGKFYFRPPGGESWCDVIFRLRGIVGDLQRNHVGARVLIVGHQVIVNCFRYLIERMDEATILPSTAKAMCRTVGLPNMRPLSMGNRWSWCAQNSCRQSWPMSR